MKPIIDLNQNISQNLIGVLTDIDDTITTRGYLPAASYAMLEQLSNSGLLVIVITGRPAGWCDMIARFWPVVGVIGENGAFAFYYDHKNKRINRIFTMDSAVRKANRDRLNNLAEIILKKVPGAAIASDQAYRETDLAIDFCEDVPTLNSDQVAQIVDCFHNAGAIAKVSSIHVNGWFGNWDKLSMTRKFLYQRFAIDIDKTRQNFIYCGDSPNDAPMFEFFPNSCGVVNVRDFLGKIDYLPTYISNAYGGDGFVEIGNHILTARSIEKNTANPRKIR